MVVREPEASTNASSVKKKKSMLLLSIFPGLCVLCPATAHQQAYFGIVYG